MILKSTMFWIGCFDAVDILIDTVRRSQISIGVSHSGGCGYRGENREQTKSVV